MKFAHVPAGEPTMDTTADVTTLLRKASTGDPAARDALYALLYPRLLRLARARLAGAGTISLDASALLHESFMRIARGQAFTPRNRNLFFAYASKVMRSVLVDHVRARGGAKRGGGVTHVTMTAAIPDGGADAVDLAPLADALELLERADPRAHRVVEMRYFGGMTEAEIADALEVSVPTVKRDWRRARAFLYAQLRPDP